MAKVRLKLGEITKYSNTEIMCKKIHSITINSKTYYKKNCRNDSMKIQNFYRMIIKNSMDITYIKFGTFIEDNFTDCTEIYLKRKLLNNYAGPAIIVKALPHSGNFKQGTYAINGVKLQKADWEIHPDRQRYLRQYKLERILKTI